MKSRKITNANKIKMGRGAGEGTDYKPWIKNRETSPMNTTYNVVNWKTGRMMELPNKPMHDAFLFLNWQSDVIDIRELYPVDVDALQPFIQQASHELAAYGETLTDGILRHVICTDFLVTLRDNTYAAYMVAKNHSAMSNAKVEQVYLLKRYWNNREVPFHLLYTDSFNKTFIQNLCICMPFYAEGSYTDSIGRFKHLVATKQITIDMTKGLITSDYINSEVN